MGAHTELTPCFCKYVRLSDLPAAVKSPLIQQSWRPLLSGNRMRSNACVLIRTLPEVREEQKNPAMAGPASLPSTGPCGAHGASDDDLEVPNRAASEVSLSLWCTSCNKMPDPLFCLLDRGEKPGHVIRSGAGSKGRTRECNGGCTGRSRAPAHVELAVPQVDDWSTSGGPSSHSALWPQDVISSQTKYRPIWSSRYFWGISYVPCGDTSKLDLHCH